MRRSTLADGTTVGSLCLGAMWFGTRTDEKTAFAILDRFVEAGGTLIDTADNYAFWAEGGAGGESETVIGRWLADRGARDQVVISTKVGAQPTVPGTSWRESGEGLSPSAIRSAIEGSLRRLGTDRVDVYWAHIEDRTVPLEETVDAFASLVEEGTVGVVGASNHALWKVERARAFARSQDRPGYTCLQLRHSYLRPRLDVTRPDSHIFGDVDAETLDYARNEPDMSLWAYSPLLSGAYAHPDRPLHPVYDHPGTPARLAAVQEVAAKTGATVNQVVLAWLMGGDPPVTPIVGVSSVEQLNEALAAADLELGEDLRHRLDDAGGFGL
ncbi:aldo/keto reductase [Actinoallomurus purpureus]|uniref:aldo/keto reductase n=1 Tax=Actinoallomurus purpureus TaxID=478114 RepID=UPI0020927A21|nr:aldo/keto reductase [Actinoallomurus purpureus]MCO6009478.1 aldo/keto reductase [Actinoallomurus purpureus]